MDLKEKVYKTLAYLLADQKRAMVTVFRVENEGERDEKQNIKCNHSDSGFYVCSGR